MVPIRRSASDNRRDDDEGDGIPNGPVSVLLSDGSAQAIPTRASAVVALQAGQRVRVRAADALNMEGVFLGLEGQDMLLRTTGAEQVQRVPVDRLRLCG